MYGASPSNKGGSPSRFEVDFRPGPPPFSSFYYVFRFLLLITNWDLEDFRVSGRRPSVFRFFRFYSFLFVFAIRRHLAGPPGPAAWAGPGGLAAAFCLRFTHRNDQNLAVWAEFLPPLGRGPFVFRFYRFISF